MPDTSDPWGQRFPPTLRIRRSAEFRRVYDHGTYAADRWLVVNICPNGLGYSRLGVVVSRKFGKAYQRQRWKRVIRDVFRRRRPSLAVGIDILVRPRKGATCESREIDKSLPQLVKRALRRQKLDRNSGD